MPGKRGGSGASPKAVTDDEYGRVMRDLRDRVFGPLSDFNSDLGAALAEQRGRRTRARAGAVS